MRVWKGFGAEESDLELLLVEGLRAGSEGLSQGLVTGADGRKDAGMTQLWKRTDPTEWCSSGPARISALAPWVPALAVVAHMLGCDSASSCVAGGLVMCVWCRRERVGVAESGGLCVLFPNQRGIQSRAFPGQAPVWEVKVESVFGNH